MKCVSLTTDFGHVDWFAGVMRGVILERAPDAQVVDLNHGIPSGDIRAGAFSLLSGYRYFPKQTVHVAVVDPGVGSNRVAIAVDTRDYFFVGPNNGVLSWALKQEEIRAVHRLENEDYFRQPVSQTFHGRDVFAPVAADLASGVNISHLGPEITDWEKMLWPDVIDDSPEVVGQVVYIDRFGNCITNIPEAAARAGSRIRIPGELEIELMDCYADADTHQALAVGGSSGFVELAINGGSAQEQLDLKTGTQVVLRTAD
ncbi:MAG: SAM hydrolase/SAM-dependent halogenase family protein [Limisphaerales bacterium]